MPSSLPAAPGAHSMTGAEIAALDWSESTLGPIDGWPPALRSTLAVMLACPTPMFLAWGPDLLCFYNDAYRPILGYRLDRALGRPFREVWASIWTEIEPLVTATLAGETRTMTDMALDLSRAGSAEESWWTFTYSPAFYDDGSIAGLFCVTGETTARIVAERDRAAADERLQLALSAGHGIGAWDWDVVADRVTSDARFAALYGVDPALAAAGAPIADFFAGIHPDDLPRVRTAIDAAMAANGSFGAEYRLRQPDGTVRWVAAQGRCVADAQGRCVRLPGISFDVTERVEAAMEMAQLARERETALVRQQALIDLTDRLRDESDPAAISRVAGGIVGATLGADLVGYGIVDPAAGTICVDADWTAPGAVGLAGVARLRDYGAYIDDLKAGRTVVVDDAFRDPRTAAHAEALAARGAVAFVNTPLRERGALVALLYVSQAQARSWTDDELTFLREVAARVRSAAERARSDRALRALNARLEAEVEARTAERDRFWRLSRDPFLVSDMAGVWLAASPAWSDILGWRADELIGRTSRWMEHPDDQARTRSEVAALAGGGTTLKFENRFRGADGEYRWFAWTAVPADDDRIYAVARDVTEEKLRAQALAEAEERLRQSQKMEAVGQLTGGLAHDFNNMLAGISGSLEVMQMRLAQGRLADAERYIVAAQGAARRAAALTHRLLAFSRRQTLDPKPTDVNRLVADMEELVRRTVGPGIEVEAVKAGGLWSTLVDQSQLENALLNLCINARDAMPEGGRIVIETANRWLDGRGAAERDLDPGQYVSLCVSDNGSGMPPDVAAKAFDPFFTTKPIGQGTGLGLSMIYGFVRQSGGQVRIYSEQGQGTMICLYLPRHGVEEQAGATALPVAEATDGEGRVVLVVDDEATIRMLVTEILRERGYATLEAADGAAALRILSSDAAIDLLITDVGLPGGMNGRQLADAGAIGRPGLRTLFITGYAENAALSHGHLGSGMHVLTKPFTMDALVTRVEELVGDDG